MKWPLNIILAMVVLCVLVLPRHAAAECPLSVADWGYLSAATPAGLTGVVSVAAGSFHGLALKDDGTVVGWGDNSYGQAMPPANLTNVIAIAGGYSHSLALKNDGTVIGWGDTSSGQSQPPANLTNVAAIACGAYHSLALKSDGTVVGWGENYYGQATPTNLAGVMAIAAGYSHSLAVLTNGTVVGWGDNTYGQATTTNLTGIVAVAGGYYHSLALKTNGIVVGWGDDSSRQATPPTNLTGVVAIAAGYFHSLALKSDGTIIGWGDNFYGEATADELTNAVAISAGYYRNVALTHAPPAPSEVAVKIAATNQIDFSWRDDSAGEDTFKIERAPDDAGIAGTWALTATVVAGISNYGDTSVSSNAVYWYRMRVHNICGDSIYSPPIKISVQIPDAPVAANANIGVSNVVELMWYNYSAGVGGFKIQRAPNAGGVPGVWVEIGTTNASTVGYNFYTDAGVSPNTTNWYRVLAFNGIGNSAFSTPVSLNIVPPVAPANVVATPYPDKVALSWNGFSGGVMGFKIEKAPNVSGSPGTWTEIALLSPANPNQDFYSDTSVTTNTTLWYRVRAFNWIGDSFYSSSVKISISPPTAPSNLTAQNGWSNRIDLAWMNTNATVVGFKIERALNHAGSPGAWTQIADVSALFGTYSDSGLDVNHTYSYRVRAYNFLGDSPYSNEAGAFVRDGQFVRVMQWNVERNLGRQANNGSFYAQCIARVINYNQPDVLLFNEIDTQSLSAAQNQTALINWITNYVSYLGPQPGTTFYVAVSTQSDGFIRNAAISRFPIISPTTYNDGLRGLHSFKVQLSVSNALQIFHTHIKCCADDCARKQTEAQFDTNIINAFAATNSLPYIFGGDLNEEEERQPPVCTLTASYHPITTLRQGGKLLDFKPTTLNGEYRTWSSQDATPSIRFDYLLTSTNRLGLPTGYVFNSADWANHGLYSGFSYDNSYASDHYPVFANYFFPGPFQIWQAQYFGNANSALAAPDADADSDGLSNVEEFLAGTSPTNPASALRITAIVQTNNNFLITWSTAGGRTNVVQAASNVKGTFSDLSVNVFTAGNGDIVTNYLDVGAATNAQSRFYRIRLAP